MPPRDPRHAAIAVVAYEALVSAARPSSAAQT